MKIKLYIIYVYKKGGLNEMFDVEHYLDKTHPDDSIDIQSDDFKADNDLIEEVNKHGVLNNVEYDISTGSIKNDGMFRIKILD